MSSTLDGKVRSSSSDAPHMVGTTNQKQGGRHELRNPASRPHPQSQSSQPTRAEGGPKRSTDASVTQEKGESLSSNFGKLSLDNAKPRAINDTRNSSTETTTGNSSKRSRNRNKKERNSDKNVKTNEKVQEVESEEARLLAELEARKKAEEEAAAAELKRIAELQRQKEAAHAALLQAKIQLESKISSACQRLEANFVQVSEMHKQFRCRLHADKLASTRAKFQLDKKNLKSDLKKCTAFCKKIKTTTSWDGPGVISSMISDVESLNLTRYIEEIVSAFLECKMRVSDIPSLVHLCVAIHERYEEFRDLFIPKLISSVSYKANSSNDDVKQKRIFLRFLTELLLAGVIQDPKPIVRIVGDACGAPSLTTEKDRMADGGSYQVTDAHMVVAFAKAAGHEIFGVIASNVIVDTDLLKSAIAQYDSAACSNQVASDQDMSLESNTKKGPTVITNSVTHMEGSVENSNQYSVSLSCIELAKSILEKVMKVSETLAVSESVSALLRSHVAGAFKTLCVSYVNSHKKLVKLEKRCEEDRLLSGCLTEQREKGLADAQRLMETLEKSVETIADVLNETIPELIVEVEDSDTMNPNEGSGIELYKREGDRDVNLGPFDDEETRLFYCDIPDFLCLIPPALLGYGVDEAEKLRASNALRFKSSDAQVDFEESVNLNTDAETFSSSGDSADDGAGPLNDDTTVSLNPENDGDGT